MINFWCSKKAKKVKGSISILLSIVLLSIFSLGSLVMEAGRFQSAKMQLSEANESASLSMLAQFNSTLQDRYGILAMDSKQVKEDDYGEYLKFNSDLNKDYYGDNISRLYGTPTYEFESLYNLSNPNILKRQIMENAKYNVPINMAADYLDIDKRLEDLMKSLGESFPGLEKILDVCQSITKIKQVLEKLYKLQVTIANLNRCEGNFNLASNLTSGLDEFISGNKAKDYDPTYKKAYNAFKKNVDEKADYMKKNPKPENPGDNPPVSNIQVTEYQNRKNDSEYKLDIKILKDLVESHKETKIFGEKKDIQADEGTQRCLRIKGEREINESSIKNVISKLAKTRLNYTIQKWNSDTLNYLLEKTKYADSASVEVLNNQYISSKSLYEQSISKNREWKNKKEKYDEYNKRISSYNSTIIAAGKSLNQRCNDLKKLLAEYKTNVESAKKGIREAITALDDIKKSVGESEANKESIVGFETLIDALENLQLNRVNTIQGYLTNDSLEIEKIYNNVDRVNESYRLNVPKRKVSNYYMGHKESVEFFRELSSLIIVDKITGDLKAVFSGLFDLVKVLNPVPLSYNWKCDVTLSDPTWDILPSNTDVVYSNSYQQDINELTNILSDAKTLLGAKYSSDISMVEPSGREADSDIVEEISSRIDSTVSALKTITGLVTSLLSGNQLKLIETIFKLSNVVQSVITLVDNLKYFANNFQQTISVITQTLYENVLLNSYIVEKFPNRVETTSGEYKGCNETLTPEIGNTSAFSAACAEYVINGDKSEKKNQEKVWHTIFILRVLNNLVCLLKDETAMEIISACGPLAIIVAPVWVCYESNMDMNCLLLLEEKVPLIKEELVLSVGGIKNLVEHLKNINTDKKMDKFDGEDGNKKLAQRLELSRKEFTSIKGKFKMKYEDYLWMMMFFKSNRTKILRTADLIQMDLRYDQVYNKGKSPTFLMSTANTFIRTKCSAVFNSVLPIIGMSRNNINSYGMRINNTKYMGY